MVQYHNNLLQALHKAVDTGVLAPVVPEDLEIQAHNTLWNDSQSTENTLLKLLPSVPATSIEHEYTRVVSFGERRGSGFFAEKSLPPETNIKTRRVVNNIRLMGEIGPTFLLASLEKTQQVLGTTGAANIERQALRMNVIRKKNRNLYFADTRTIRQGVGGVRNKGLLQLIEEGTDGTDGDPSPFGSHVIDMKGDPLTPETLRDRISEAIILFGYLTCLIMDPFTRGDFEAGFDSAQRLEMPISLKPYVIGQQIAGLQTQGGVCYFHTDNILNPIHHFGRYVNELEEGAPVGLAQNQSSTLNSPGSAGTEWDANSAGEIYWIVTQMKDEQESLGVRIPATPGTFVTVAAGDDVDLTFTASDPTIDGFRIYRGTDADPNQAIGTDAYWIADVANTPGLPVTFVDQNLQRPNTSFAFAFNIVGAAQQALSNPLADGLASMYYSARERSADFLMAPDDPRNTVAVASLGPSMGIMALASVLAEVDRPLMYSAYSPELRNPFQSFAFKNIGRA